MLSIFWLLAEDFKTLVHAHFLELFAGAAGMSVSDSAKALVNAMVDKYKDGSGSIHEVRLVLTDLVMIPKFVSTVKHVISQSVGLMQHADKGQTLKSGKDMFRHWIKWHDMR